MPKFALQKNKKAQKVKIPAKKDMKPMYAEVTFGQIPKKDSDAYIKELNQLIDEYNKKSNDVDKIAVLKSIQDKIQKFEYKYPASYFASSLEYRETKKELFQEIKLQCSSMGIPTLNDPRIKINPSAKSSPLADIIANMSPDKSSVLLEILVEGPQSGLRSQLKSIYNRNDKTEEANAFRNFLKTHEISYLGGGNTHNFKVTRLSDSSEAVLKVENRFDMPRDAESNLREKLPGRFTGIDAERLSFTYHKLRKEYIARTLMVTEFCSSGSIADYGNNSIDNTERLVENAGKIFEQMASTFIDMQNAGCVFPDAKNSNWLVDSTGKVRIADTKSFHFTDGKNYSKTLDANKYYLNFPCTQDYIPDEFKNPPFEADKMHSFMLGKNLYNFATGKQIDSNSGKTFDFKYPFFNTTQGQQFKQLIIDLVKPDAVDRIPVATALETLKSINLIAELDKLKFGKNDKEMEDYIKIKQQQFANADTSEKRQVILQELQDTVSSLKTNKELIEIKHIADDFREKEGIFTVGMKAKAKRIEAALSHIPIKERCNFIKSEQKEIVLEALASRRSEKGKIYRTSEGAIDEKKAAQSFKDFKSKFLKEAKEDKTDTVEHQVDSSLKK